MTSLLVALALSQATLAYPAPLLLAAFKNVCVDPLTSQSMRAAAIRTGWTPFEPAGDDEFDRRARKYHDRTAVESNGGAEWTSFRRAIGGRQLLLVISDQPYRRSQPDLRLLDCFIHDSEASAPIDEAAVRAWADREPRVRGSGDMAKWFEWQPGLSGGESSLTYIGFISIDPKYAELASFTGVKLASKKIEQGR